MGAGASHVGGRGGYGGHTRNKYLANDADDGANIVLESKSMRLPLEKDPLRSRKHNQYISSDASTRDGDGFSENETGEQGGAGDALVTIQRLAAAHHLRKVGKTYSHYQCLECSLIFPPNRCLSPGEIRMSTTLAIFDEL
jgi:hypothetical protein